MLTTSSSHFPATRKQHCIPISLSLLSLFYAQVSARVCSPTDRSKGQRPTSGKCPGTRSPRTPCRLSPFIYRRVNEICRHLIGRLLWVASFLCQVKIIERFRRLDGPLGFPQWLICYYCRSSRGDGLDGGEDEEEVTPALSFWLRNVTAVSYGL